MCSLKAPCRARTPIVICWASSEVMDGVERNGKVWDDMDDINDLL